jgi:hypothetical protein
LRILLCDNTVFEMNFLPEVIDDLRFCVLDYSSQDNIDFYFIPLVFLDVFPRPSANLRIGNYRIQMQLDWSVVIADKDFGYMEIIELKDLRDRPFEALIFNPITGFMPSFGEITHLNNFPDVTWNMPKLKYGHILVVPLESRPNPACAFFVRDIHRLPEALDITKVFS